MFVTLADLQCRLPCWTATRQLHACLACRSNNAGLSRQEPALACSHAHECSVLRHHGHACAEVGMAEFEKLMAASARLDLLDSHEISSMPTKDLNVKTPERAIESRHMNTLGLTPPRSLLSSFSAAAGVGAASCRLSFCNAGKILILKRTASPSVFASLLSAAAVLWTLLLCVSCAWESCWTTQRLLQGTNQ